MKVHKKRGRKPKGGKIITSPNISIKDIIPELQNIILHLKVRTSKLYNQPDYGYGTIKPVREYKEIEIQNKPNLSIPEKLKDLKLKLHSNNIITQSSCFWCTYNFKSTTIYIPKNIIENKYNVYGSFCSPQCAAAFLFNELIDMSIKHERYQLLNYIYTKIYNYDNPIIPSPDPHYMLNTYYGNLTMNEYQALISKNDKNITIINKPISKVFPELHDETNVYPENDYKKYYNISSSN